MFPTDRSVSPSSRMQVSFSPIWSPGWWISVGVSGRFCQRVPCWKALRNCPAICGCSCWLFLYLIPQTNRKRLWQSILLLHSDALVGILHTTVFWDGAGDSSGDMTGFLSRRVWFSRYAWVFHILMGRVICWVPTSPLLKRKTCLAMTSSFYGLSNCADRSSRMEIVRVPQHKWWGPQMLPRKQLSSGHSHSLQKYV